MKLKLKTLAVVAALAATGAAHADFVGSTAAPGNSTFGVLAWNTQTSSYYLRDLGYLLNSFLPNGSQSMTGSGEASPIFDKTPEAGLTIDKTSNANFGADAAWSTWFSAQNAADIRWLVIGGDSNGTSTGVNTYREVVSMAQGSTHTVVSVGTITNGATNVNGFAFTNGTLSNTGTLSAQLLGAANGSFINQAGKTTLLDQQASLWYFSRNNAGTGSSAAGLEMQFGNSLNFATISLSSAGDVVYSLAPAVSAVPLPAAAWLMGAGLMAVGGFVRRRKAAAEA